MPASDPNPTVVGQDPYPVTDEHRNVQFWDIKAGRTRTSPYWAELATARQRLAAARPALAEVEALFRKAGNAWATEAVIRRSDGSPLAKLTRAKEQARVVRDETQAAYIELVAEVDRLAREDYFWGRNRTTEARAARATAEGAQRRIEAVRTAVG